MSMTPLGGRAEFIIAVVWKCVISMTDIIYINEARKPGKINGFAEWTHYKKGSNEEIEISKSFRDEMIKKEQTLEIEIQKQIDELVIKNAGGL